MAFKFGSEIMLYKIAFPMSRNEMRGCWSRVRAHPGMEESR